MKFFKRDRFGKIVSITAGGLLASYVLLIISCLIMAKVLLIPALDAREAAQIEEYTKCHEMGGMWVRTSKGGTSTQYSAEYCVDKSVILIVK